MTRLHKFVLNLYFIFTGISILLNQPLLTIFYWCISWLLYLFIDITFGDKND